MSEFCEAPLSGNDFEAGSSCTQRSDGLHLVVAAAAKSMDTVGFTINTINLVLISLVTIGMSWKCIQMKLVKTATHAFLCTLGFVFLFAEGLLARFSTNPLTHSLQPETKATLFYVLQLIGGLLGIIGTLQKSIAKKKHFHTLHGKFGIAACVYCSVYLISSSLSLFCESYRSNISPLANKLIHSCLGLVTLSFAMLAQYTGYDTGFFRRNFTKQNGYKFVTFVIFVLTALMPFKMLMKQFSELIS